MGKIAIAIVAACLTESVLADAAPCEPLPGRAGTCGHIEVPVRHGEPDSGTLPLHFIVIHAAAPTAAAGIPLVLLPGGPGFGAAARVEDAEQVAAAFPTHDLLLVDQRGTGRSKPLTCDGLDDGTLPIAQRFGTVFDTARTTACRAAHEAHADLSRFLTIDAANDLELLRQSIGYPRLALWGTSYGTRLAQTYARAYPEAVSALILDSPVPFDLAAPSTYGQTLDDAYERFAALCDAQPECAREYGDLRAHLKQAQSALAVQPATVLLDIDAGTVPVAFDAGDLGYAVRGMLYRGAASSTLPGAVRAASGGDFRPLAEAYAARIENFRGFATALHFSIFCAEDVRFIPPTTTAASTLLTGRLLAEMVDACRDWPMRPLPPGFREPLRTHTPTLILSGELDPVTPPEFGTAISAFLPNAVHRIFPGVGHGVFPAAYANECVRAAITSVLAGAAADDTCWAALAAPRIVAPD